MKNLKIRANQFLLFVCVVVSGVSGLSQAQAEDPNSPGQIVISTVEKMRAEIKAEKNSLSPEQLDSKIREIVTPTFDFPEMSKRCLGDKWKDGTPEQQQEFITSFSDLLARTYVTRIRKGLEESGVKLSDEKVEGGKAIVRTTVIDTKGTFVVDYRLFNLSGSWKVYDVIIENVGLVSTYRTEFSDIVRNEKFEGLLKRLREKQVKVKPLA